MRKIESEMNSAIRQRRNWSKANTSVTVTDRVVNVHLHGNLIARIGDTFIQIFDGGWQSVTTKSRLNAILDEVSYGAGVFQQNWNWYLNDNKFGTVPFFSGIEVSADS
jgi:hypothetical protein|tara:strand:+ start:7946 stop:8269 length:324 start_codon:yes stop_codon:yes gene_type:complete